LIKIIWNFTKVPNYDGSKGQKITFKEEEGRTITGKAAANAFAKEYETERNTSIPLARTSEVRTDERERTKTAAHDIMQNDITMPQLKKSPGPDYITHEILQHLCNSAIRTLLDILNLSSRQGQVPQCWKEAIMMPILKRDQNRSKVLSYRPISLTISCCKLMEGIINKRM
jgi:hypothetical protein